MLFVLDGEVPEDLGVIVSDYFFWFYSPVFTVIKVVLSIYSPVYYQGFIVVPLSVLSPCELAAATDMCHGLCTLLTQPESRILHSVVDFVSHCPGVEGLLLHCHD